MHVVAPECTRDRLASEQPVVACEQGHTDACNGGKAGCLIAVEVAGALEQHFVAGTCVNAARDQIGHGTARHKQRRRPPGKFGAARLQPVDGRVFTEDVVAYLRVRDRRTHGVGWPRQGVTAEIDDVTRGSHAADCSSDRSAAPHLAPFSSDSALQSVITIRVPCLRRPCQRGGTCGLVK